MRNVGYETFDTRGHHRSDGPRGPSPGGPGSRLTVSEATTATPEDEYADSPLKRSITGRLLFFYVLGDVLGSGIYVLIGAVAGEVGGAFWAAFAVGVTVAAFTGLAYAELATKFPQAAGA